MSRTTNNSGKQQRSVTVTLIDLENAFGEVNHSLFHSLIHSLYQMKSTVLLNYCIVSKRDVPWKIIFSKLGNTPTKMKMTPSINFFCQGDWKTEAP